VAEHAVNKPIANTSTQSKPILDNHTLKWLRTKLLVKYSSSASVVWPQTVASESSFRHNVFATRFELAQVGKTPHCKVWNLESLFNLIWIISG